MSRRPCSDVDSPNFGLAQYGAAQEQINVGDVVDFVVPVPPPDVQRDLLLQLGTITDRQRRLGAALKSQMTRFDELKRSSITTAVTGDFDVSSADGSQVPIQSDR